MNGGKRERKEEEGVRGRGRGEGGGRGGGFITHSNVAIVGLASVLW